MNELLDIVNEHDQIIDQRYRSEIYEKKLSCFRVINAFLVNDKKQLWIPLRSKSKKLFPLCLDASVGGHAMAGEIYQEAFARELKEELNLDISQCTYEMIAKLTPHEHNVSAFMHLYLIRTNANPHYNHDDFESAEWLSVHEIQTKMKSGIPTKGDLPILIEVVGGFL